MGEYLDNVLLYLILCFIIIIFGYFLIRSYFANYDLKGNRFELNKRIRILAIVVGVITIITIVDMKYSEVIKTSFSSSNGISGVMYWIQSYFLSGANTKYVFRVVSMIFLLAGTTGIIVFGIFKKDILLFISFIVGIASPFFVSMDFSSYETTNMIPNKTYIKLNLQLNIIGIIFLVIFVALMIIIFYNNMKTKKKLEITKE